MSKNKKILFIILAAMSVAGAFLFFVVFNHNKNQSVIADILRLDDQEATVRAIKKVSPAVVSIVVLETVEIRSLDQDSGLSISREDKEERSVGTGFLISADGLIITNKHVIDAVTDDKKAEYKIKLANGKRYFAQLIGRDPLNDLAILKIFDKNLPSAELGDSDRLTQGITVVAIGNSLGLYQNSVTKGIVSALGRDIVASDTAGKSESLGNVIQTDAEINLGNSGGPLVDLNGKVVGINVATDSSGKSIGFAIPINDAKPVIKSVREIGRIVRPRLGIRYLMITQELATDNKLPLNTGAWVSGSGGQPAVLAGSPAAKAGVLAGDIITEIDGVKLNEKNTLLSVMQRYKPGQKIGLKIRRDAKYLIVIAVLDEFK
jgi:S1-C subfamily serine protease